MHFAQAGKEIKRGIKNGTEWLKQPNVEYENCNKGDSCMHFRALPTNRHEDAPKIDPRFPKGDKYTGALR